MESLHHRYRYRDRYRDRNPRMHKERNLLLVSSGPMDSLKAIDLFVDPLDIAYREAVNIQIFVSQCHGVSIPIPIPIPIPIWTIYLEKLVPCRLEPANNIPEEPIDWHVGPMQVILHHSIESVSYQAWELSKMKCFISVGLIVLISIPLAIGTGTHGAAVAAPPDQPVVADAAERDRAEAEIRQAARAYLAALQRGDGKAIAACWSTDGIYVDVAGHSTPARELAIREFTAPAAAASQASADSGDRIDAKAGTIHWVSANVALERGTITQAEAETVATAEIKFLAVWVKRDNRWLLDYLQETAGQKSSSPGKLGDLGWMVGHWTTNGTGPRAQISVNWSAGKKYLVQKFKLELPDQQELQGEQRIAWDPVRGSIRSWLFRSDGGFAESSWSQEDETWIVKIQGVNASGTETSAINMWTADGPDRCWFKSFRLPEGQTSAAAVEQEEVILQFQRMLTAAPDGTAE
jgi:uncharacterized protein (TIGR02246 family)